MAKAFNSRSGRAGRVTREERIDTWRHVGNGERVDVTAELVGLSVRTVQRLITEAGGMPPRRTDRNARELSASEREEIFIGINNGESNRQIGVRIDRPHTTVGREIKRNGGRDRYRPFAAEHRAEQAARRPKPCKLETNQELCASVEEGLKQKWSPQQISARLRLDFPDEPEMRVSHETIYRALYLQGRGELRTQLAVCLRSGRVRRKPRTRTSGTSTNGPGKIPDMVNITNRPAEAEDRAVIGHWEGDLIMGSTVSNSAIATLVERSSRFVMLIGLGTDHTASHVAAKLTELIRRLPDELRRSLTWDQGGELSQHVKITFDTGLEIYFCDPHSPWQRGTNENTNGLLRQYLPKGTDLSIYTQADLDIIAAELNGRPRQTLGWMTPSEKLMELLMVH